MNKQKGFTYVDTIISLVIMSIISVVMLQLIVLKNGANQQAQDDEILTTALINIVEELQAKIAQGDVIVGLASLAQLGGYDNIKGNVNIKKDYVPSGSSVYIASFDLRYKKCLLKEIVVLYGSR